MENNLIKPINNDLDYDKNDVLVCLEICVTDMIKSGDDDTGGRCRRICKPWVR